MLCPETASIRDVVVAAQFKIMQCTLMNVIGVSGLMVWWVFRIENIINHEKLPGKLKTVYSCAVLLLSLHLGWQKFSTSMHVKSYVPKLRSVLASFHKRYIAPPTFTFIRITEVHFWFRMEIFLLQRPDLRNLQWVLLEQQKKHHNICDYSENIYHRMGKLFCLLKSQFLINSAITRCSTFIMCYCILYTNRNSIGLSQIFYFVLPQAVQI